MKPLSGLSLRVPFSITRKVGPAALEKVPEDFREVLLLADVQEFSYKEISDTLKIPIGTVMSRLSRGRKILRSQLTHLASNTRVKAASVGAK